MEAKLAVLAFSVLLLFALGDCTGCCKVCFVQGYYVNIEVYETSA